MEVPNLLNLEEVEFEVKREPWNVYRLCDGTILKFRTIVVKFFKTPHTDPTLNLPIYVVAYQNVLSVKSPVRDKPNPPPSQRLAEISPELREEVEIEDVLREEWNRYMVEGKYIYELKPVITRIIKLKGFFDPAGYPIYHVISQNVSRIKEAGGQA
ncbi:MAG: hypothetical protein DRN06_08075 [Thermoprotei archaeon]|nr:MAG: hypothetical protein DRN06_08075 [Thermoprotei archaeon]